MHSLSPTTSLRAAWLALFAMALIVVAPLISVTLQKNAANNMPGMMHHEVPEMSGMMMHHDMSQMPSHAMNDDVPLTSHIDHAEACGYCVLLTHVPGLVLLAVLLVFGWLRQRVIRRFIRAEPLWLFTPWSRPHTRAPPRLPAFS